MVTELMGKDNFIVDVVQVLEVALSIRNVEDEEKTAEGWKRRL